MSMRARFRGKDFLSLMDYTALEIEYILQTAADLKLKWTRREPHEYLRGRVIAMLFEKPSTRTRFSFHAAASNLGADSFFATPQELQLSRGEPIKDTARIIDRYCDGLVIRTFGQEIVDEYAKYMVHPVINALTNLTHPCRAWLTFSQSRSTKGGSEV